MIGIKNFFSCLSVSLLIFSCSSNNTKMEEETGNAPVTFTGAKGEIKLMTLDPGHFHASLVQKSMYDQVSPTVYVYSKEGSELDAFLASIEAYNNSEDDPTHWEMEVYTGADFLQKMIRSEERRVGKE